MFPVDNFAIQMDREVVITAAKPDSKLGLTSSSDEQSSDNDANFSSGNETILALAPAATHHQVTMQLGKRSSWRTLSRSCLDRPRASLRAGRRYCDHAN
jgi:hypothetical protein